MALFLLKPGELSLKRGNREGFERVLRRNLAARVRGLGARITARPGRVFVTCPDENAARVEAAVEKLIGIAGWARARACDKTVEAVLAACVEEARALSGRGLRTFKIEARRTDKGFPLSSYELCCAAGDAARAAVPGLSVDVRAPEAVIRVEIRERAYLYGGGRRGRGGLPVGSAGRGLLLLSGGIDSPLAGYLMLRRGMGLDAAYFHAWPYTSDEARRKAVTLAGILGAYGMGLRLFVIPFTPVETRIKERAPEPWRTVLLRMAMMDCAGNLARRRGDKCLVTGESLSQVASQTIENLRCTESAAGLPVLRPLIGMDKEEIIERAKALGTYETSILPYEDCCVLFSPAHPVLRGSLTEASALYASLAAAPLIEEALVRAETVKCAFPE
ncbi:MAG: tRNA 4-thiouridine(8) synthase ThiI [Treponematales bacterium]